MQEQLEKRHNSRPLALLSGLGAASLSIGHRIETDAEGLRHVGDVTSVQIVRPHTPDLDSLGHALEEKLYRDPSGASYNYSTGVYGMNRAQRRAARKKMLRRRV